MQPSKSYETSAYIMAKNGGPQFASAILAQVEGPAKREKSYVKVAKKLANEGLVAETFAFIAQASGYFYQNPKALKAIAKRLASVGQLENATFFAQLVQNREIRGYAFGCIAEGYEQIGNHEMSSRFKKMAQDSFGMMM